MDGFRVSPPQNEQGKPYTCPGMRTIPLESPVTASYRSLRLGPVRVSSMPRNPQRTSPQKLVCASRVSLVECPYLQRPLRSSNLRASTTGKFRGQDACRVRILSARAPEISQDRAWASCRTSKLHQPRFKVLSRALKVAWGCLVFKRVPLYLFPHAYLAQRPPIAQFRGTHGCPTGYPSKPNNENGDRRTNPNTRIRVNTAQLQTRTKTVRPNLSTLRPVCKVATSPSCISSIPQNRNVTTLKQKPKQTVLGSSRASTRILVMLMVLQHNSACRLRCCRLGFTNSPTSVKFDCWACLRGEGV